ncbi:DUF6049 family protein [Qaidamihabitans albus]|uniref:DUF6049 family protein n=1 Tax=Qaidamihabitans albus TaxID=2795733 RepID=UPI0018F11E5C|nr:DUF6049 family protein [Qaidamihabitans albus]
MTRFGAFALALAFLFAQGLLGAPAGAQPLPAEPTMLELDVEQLSPRMVTPDSGALSVLGSVTNVSDRRISDIVARLQLGERQDSGDELAETLNEPPPTDSPVSDWIDIADTLEPGQSAQVRITVPLADGSLPVTDPGVYPMLLNVNGTPSYGGAARLAALHLLLPVLGVPGQAPPQGDQPASMSMLWPIAASEPKVVEARYERPVVLADDGLAGELRAGGRLDALVSAALAHRDDPDLFGSLCFAIDPELVETVKAMTRGYRVRTPSGEVSGKGRADAERWLESLRQLVASHCVVQLPYAGADLTALTELHSGAELVADAVNGTSILSVLGVQPRQGVLWPGSVLSGPALRMSSAAGVNTVLTGPAQLEADPAGTRTTEIDGTGVRAVPYDALVNTALTGEPSRIPGRVTPADEPEVATQNGLAALALRTGLGDAQQTGDPLLVAPPQRWDATAGELGTLLSSVETLRSAGMVSPAPLEDLLAGPANGSAALNGGQEAAGADPNVPGSVLRTLSAVESTAADLQRAMAVDPTRQVEPIRLIRPLHNAVLRAASNVWHDRIDQGSAAAATAQAQVDTLRGQVSVATPSQPVSLASGSSPLPVTLRNELPVAITVRLQLENSAGLRPADIQDTPLAADSRVGRLIPAEALRSGRFNVDVSLTTPGGTKLGSPAHLELTSTELGTFTVVLTATAGAALVLLAGRRIYRRVKADRS